MHFAAGPQGRDDGQASAALPLLDNDTASPASRRLASAHPALAPKCITYSSQALTASVLFAQFRSFTHIKDTGFCNSKIG
jgi:hypothetical protein